MTEQDYISLLKRHIRSLESQFSLLSEQFKAQAKQLKLQAEENASLKQKVSDLLAVLQKQGIKKDSHNSHLPPSKDLFPTKKSLRGPSRARVVASLVIKAIHWK